MPHRRPARRYARTLLGLGLAVVVMVGLAGVWSVANAAATAYFVSPTGADTNAGTSAAAPFRSIQKALDLATPGTVITLAPGEYHEALATKVDGTAAGPITIKGPETGKDVAGRYRAVLYGTGGNVVSINHSYYTLTGFTIDGQAAIAHTEYPSALAAVRAFKDSVQGRAVNSKLVYVGADDAAHDITGTRITDMFLNGSGGECVRFRNRAAASLVADSVIQWCGVYGPADDVAKYRYHNGEGIYIGTSDKSTDQPMYASDTSHGIVVRDSVVHTFGAECFEVKENAHDNRLEDTDCGDNDEPLSFKGSNIELRGDHNLVRRATVHDSRSWNVKLATDAAQYDRGGNSIQLSTFSAAAPDAAAVHADESTNGSTFCGNTFATAPYTEGLAKLGDPRQACVGVDTERPTVSITSPAGGATVSGTVAITATAADDHGVVRVDFEVDGVPLGSATAAPWTQNWAVPTGAGPHTITVTAHDAADNVATAQVTVTAGTGSAPPPTTAPAAPAAQPIALEAESGTVVAPMTVATDAAAQGGKYVVQSTGSGTGSVGFSIPVPVAATFALALRVIGPSTSSDSFTYSVDGGQAQVLNLPSSARTAWTWINGPSLTWGVGTHTLVVNRRENGARLDALTLTPPVAPTPSTTPTPLPTTAVSTTAPPTAVGTSVPVPTTAPAVTATPPATTAPPASTVTPTAAAPTTTVAPAPPVIIGTTPFEAEAGTLSAGMALATDTLASGGTYVVARTAGGTATYTVSVPTTGSYMIAGWVKAANANSDSFTVRFDTATSATWVVTQARSWTYDATSNPVFTLAAGTHTLTVGYREAGASVDRLVLVKR